MGKIIPLEETEQIITVKYLEFLYRKKVIIDYWATLNENKEARSIRVGVKLKQLGKKKGISDLTIIFKNFTLYLEMKRELKTLKNGKMSNSHSKPNREQIEFINRMNTTKHNIATVAYGSKMAINIINKCIKYYNLDAEQIRYKILNKEF